MTMECPVCATSDEQMIRICQLRNVFPSCLASDGRSSNVPTKVRPEDDLVVEDGE